MKIKITKPCKLRGTQLKKSAEFETPADITEADARYLISIGCATESTGTEDTTDNLEPTGQA